MSHKEKTNVPDMVDLIGDDFEKFEHFAVSYWRQIFYACGAIIVLVALGAIGMSIKSSMDNKALNTLSGAKTIEEIEKALQEYPDNKASANTRLRLAGLQIGKKEYAKAEDIYRQLLLQDIPIEVRSRAQLNLAYIFELEGKNEQASADFEKVGVNGLFSEAVRYEAKFSLARLCNSSKQVEKAKSILKELKAAKAQSAAASFWLEQAQVLLDQINALNPDLAPGTSAASVPAPASPAPAPAAVK